MENSIKNFSAAYRDGRVHLGGRSYPAGFFAVQLLNEFYVNDVGARLAVFRLANWNTAKQLEMGYLYDADFVKAGNEILYILDVLPQIKPFDMMDIDEEKDRIQNLFTEETATVLTEYFRQRVVLATMDDAFKLLGHFPPAYDKTFCKDAAGTLNDVRKTLAFYDSLGDGCRVAFEKLQQFVRHSASVTHADETHLLPIAMEIFGSTPFEVESEYVPQFKTETGKNAVVARRLHFGSFYSFIITDFFEGLHYGHYPRRCGICKRYFLMTSARHQMYCTGYAKELYRGRRITCRNMAAIRNQKERAENDPIADVYNRRCSAIRAEVSRGTITREFAALARFIAKEHRQRAVQDAEYANGQYCADMERSKLYADTGRRCRD